MQEKADSSALQRPFDRQTAILPRKSSLFGGRFGPLSPRRRAGFARRSRKLDFNPTRSYLTGPEDVQEMRGFTGA
jgi:hypothetical protein